MNSITLTRRQFIGGVTAAGASAALVRAESAPRWQIGCYTRPWAEHDWRVALDGIAAAGYNHAGIMTAKGGVIIGPTTPDEQVATIAAEAKARALRIVSIYGGDFLNPKSHDASVVALRRLIDRVQVCACPDLLLGGTGKAELVEAYYKAVRECCDYAAAHGVRLTVKPHGGQNATGPQCRRLIESVGHAAFRLWYDPGNIFYYSDGKLDPVDDAATVDGLVTGMSVKDWLPPKNVSVTPGTGRVEFAKVFARLRRGGFTGGPLVVECTATGDRAQVTAEARKAREFVETLVR
ncbi:MAG: sugar phosphate isomerase/epimerase [Verrucomicrobia bacterium]|nr:sugar phosphate isomerase/epimerase [Verrucomicrobiota bacterium]